MLLRPGGACKPQSLIQLFEGCDDDPFGLPVPDPALPFPAWLAQLRNDALAGTSYLWTIELPSQRPVGTIRIGQINSRRKSAQLSYWIAPQYRRRYYATAAGRLALNFAFSTAALTRIDTWIEAHNIASRKVALRLGFKRSPDTAPQKPISAYSLLARDFQPLSGAPMLTIRQDQLEAFHAAELISFVRSCVAETERDFPNALEVLPGGRGQAVAYAEAAASRAQSLGFRQPGEIRAFVQLALCIGPHFDLYPKVRELLTAPGLELAQRLASLDDVLTPEDWQNAARHRGAVPA